MNQKKLLLSSFLLALLPGMVNAHMDYTGLAHGGVSPFYGQYGSYGNNWYYDQGLYNQQYHFSPIELRRMYETGSTPGYINPKFAGEPLLRSIDPNYSRRCDRR